jgi:predicted DNA-binding transcriptional regulator YafY
VELSKEGVHRCEGVLGLSFKVNVRQDGSGWIDDHCRKSDIPFLTTFYIGLGNEATVKHPPELVNSMKGLLTEMLAKYDGELGE